MSKRIAIIYYSTWGHTRQMAEAVKKGVDAVDGVEGVLLQVAETLSKEVLEKMHAVEKSDPVVDPTSLAEYDGFIFGMPTRFGMMPAQMKAMFDATGQLWQQGALVGKPAGVFVCTGTQGGGQETTALTAITQLAHHGMIFIPVGYTFGEKLFDIETVRGGSAYGAGTYAGPTGQRQPTQLELDHAEHQGKYFAGKALKLM